MAPSVPVSPDEPTSFRNWTLKKRLPRSFKFLAYAGISFCSLFPIAFISFFQQTHGAQEAVEELALNLASLAHEAQETVIAPELAVAWMRGHKLVLWASYFKQDHEVAQGGLPPRPDEESRIHGIVLNTKAPIRKQLPEPQFLFRPGSEYRFTLPIQGKQERLEIVVSYESLYSAARDALVLSGALFFLAFFFLLGAVLFVDAYVSSFSQGVIRAIRSGGIPKQPFPTYAALMEALEYREDQLIDTRKTLETVFSGLQSGVAMISSEMKIVLVNQFFRSLLDGCPSEGKLVGGPCVHLNLPGQVSTVEALCERTLSSLEPQMQEVRVEGDRYFSQEAYPLLDQQNELVAIIVQCRDISVEKKSHETIQNFNDELRRQLADQKRQIEVAQQKLLQTARLAAVGELAGGVAHEINNPNGLILAGSRYVLNRLESDAVVPEYVSKYLQRITRQSERVAQIVSALLTFSRRSPSNKEPMKISDAIDEAFELAEARIGRGKISIIKDLSPDLPPIVGNRGQLTQVFLNLFNNSVDAMPDGGELHIAGTVEAGESHGLLKVKVRDRGAGISPDLLDKVLEPFFTTKPPGKGTGLGLSVSLGIMEEHGGSMSAGNHPDGGAEFELTFPLSGEK